MSLITYLVIMPWPNHIPSSNPNYSWYLMGLLRLFITDYWKIHWELTIEDLLCPILDSNRIVNPYKYKPARLPQGEGWGKVVYEVVNMKFSCRALFILNGLKIELTGKLINKVAFSHLLSFKNRLTILKL